MGCNSQWGQSKSEQELDELIRNRGYFKGHVPTPDTCLRCGSMVYFMKWDVHDAFHDRTDREFERENKHGLYSDHFALGNHGNNKDLVPS